MTCAECEYNKERAANWRREAYKLAGHPLPEPDRKPLTDESIVAMWHQPVLALAALEFARAIERAHGIGDNT